MLSIDIFTSMECTVNISPHQQFHYTAVNVTILAPLQLLVVVQIPPLHYSDNQLSIYHRTRGGQHAVA